MVATKRGPAPKPMLQVVREGNPGKRPIRQELTPPPGMPEEPDWGYLVPEGDDPDRSERVRAFAKKEWHRITPILNNMGILTRLDGPVVEEFCVMRAKLVEVERQIEMGSYTDGKLRLFTRANALRSQLKPMYGMLGLAPALRIEAKEAAGDDDGWD